MINRADKPKTNRHAGTNGHANGHAPASTERGGISLYGNHAASDDERGASAANAAPSASAAGTDRSSCADAAPPPLPGRGTQSAEGDASRMHFPGPTDLEAMQDAGAYVNAVAEHVDLVAASVRLVESNDEKIAKSELDRLREMKFGKVAAAAAVAEEAPRLDFTDWPHPQR